MRDLKGSGIPEEIVWLTETGEDVVGFEALLFEPVVLVGDVA